MSATLVSHSVREEYRGTARTMRDNAGLEREHVEAVAAFGAAARRLRQSVRGGSDDGVMRRPMRRPATAD